MAGCGRESKRIGELEKCKKGFYGASRGKTCEHFSDRCIGRRHLRWLCAASLQERWEGMRKRWHVLIDRVPGGIDLRTPGFGRGVTEPLQNVNQSAVEVGRKEIGRDPIGLPARLRMRVIQNGEIKGLAAEPRRPVEKRMLFVVC